MRLMTLLFVMINMLIQAQEVIVNGKEYLVKENIIFKDGKDITKQISLDERKAIFKALESSPVVNNEKVNTEEYSSKEEVVKENVKVDNFVTQELKSVKQRVQLDKIKSEAPIEDTSKEDLIALEKAYDTNKIEEEKLKTESKRIKEAGAKLKEENKKLSAKIKSIKKTAKVKAKLSDAVDKQNKAIIKYEQLKNKGELSPVDEVKWLEKIDKLKAAKLKIKSKLNDY